MGAATFRFKLACFLFVQEGIIMRKKPASVRLRSRSPAPSRMRMCDLKALLNRSREAAVQNVQAVLLSEAAPPELSVRRSAVRLEAVSPWVF